MDNSATTNTPPQTEAASSAPQLFGPSAEDILAWNVAEKAKKILLRHAIVLTATAVVLGVLGYKSFNDVLLRAEARAGEVVEKKIAELTEKQYTDTVRRKLLDMQLRTDAEMAIARTRMDNLLQDIAGKIAAPQTSQQVRELLAAQDKGAENDTPWVYLGKRRNSHWEEQVFSIEDIPEKGREITAAKDVFKRTDRARYNEKNSEWVFGNVVGLVRKGQSVKVLKTEAAAIEGGLSYWWVQISK